MNDPSPNADASEIAKFEALASRWWDPKGEFRPLHDINPARLSFIADRAGLAGKRVVDVGCGGGLLTEALAAAGAEVVGIDLGAAPLRVAELHAAESGSPVTYRNIGAEELAAGEAGRYDVVTCLELLEHVPDPGSTIEACKRLVKPGGDLFFSTINRTPTAYLLAVIGAEYLLGVLPKGTHDYARFIRPSELDARCRRSGLRLRELTGMAYNPLTGGCRLGRGVAVNYLAWYQRDGEG